MDKLRVRSAVNSTVLLSTPLKTSTEGRGEGTEERATLKAPSPSRRGEASLYYET